MSVQSKLEQISYAQKQRLAFIDFSLFFKGHLSRQDLLDKFEVGLSAASRDFTTYKELVPNNLYYDNSVSWGSAETISGLDDDGDFDALFMPSLPDDSTSKCLN